MSGTVQASRGPLSRLAGARAQPLAALVYAASEESPAARTPSLASAKPQPRTTDLCEIVARSFLVATGDATKALQPVKEDRSGFEGMTGFIPPRRTAFTNPFDS